MIWMFFLTLSNWYADNDYFIIVSLNIGYSTSLPLSALCSNRYKKKSPSRIQWQIDSWISRAEMSEPKKKQTMGGRTSNIPNLLYSFFPILLFLIPYKHIRTFFVYDNNFIIIFIFYILICECPKKKQTVVTSICISIWMCDYEWNSVSIHIPYAVYVYRCSLKKKGWQIDSIFVLKHINMYMYILIVELYPWFHWRFRIFEFFQMPIKYYLLKSNIKPSVMMYSVVPYWHSNNFQNFIIGSEYITNEMLNPRDLAWHLRLDCYVDSDLSYII